MNEKHIWKFLFDRVGNAYGIAGLMGNLYAESGLNSENLQGAFNKKLGMTDSEYTAAVNDGSYTNFIHDGAGYGLAQWTYWSRKQNLLNYAKEQGASIGDMDMQLGFLWKELQSYAGVMNILRNAKSVREASDAVLLKYERPADQSESVQEKRAEYGQKYYDKYAEKRGDIVMVAPARHCDEDIAQLAYGSDCTNYPPSTENEQWADLKGFEGEYRVSTAGRVYSLPRINRRGARIRGR